MEINIKFTVNSKEYSKILFIKRTNDILMKFNYLVNSLTKLGQNIDSGTISLCIGDEEFAIYTIETKSISINKENITKGIKSFIEQFFTINEVSDLCENSKKSYYYQFLVEDTNNILEWEIRQQWNGKFYGPTYESKYGLEKDFKELLDKQWFSVFKPYFRIVFGENKTAKISFNIEESKFFHF